MEFNKYTDRQIINMDESVIYLDSPSNYTQVSKGSKRVKAATAGGERVRLSTAFTATAISIKLLIYTTLYYINRY